MVKLIMTDIDGTLIPDGTMDINPEYFEVIEKLVEKYVDKNGIYEGAIGLDKTGMQADI